MSKSARRNASKARRLAKKERAADKRRFRHRLLTTALAATMAVGYGSHPAYGDGVGLVFTSVSLPDATVAVIDPESGTSSGGSGSDVNLAVGDIILFRFAFAPVPNAAVHGVAGFMTEYVPAGTDVVGVRFLDANGLTIEPNKPGIARDGCHNNNTCEFGSGTTLDCSAGRCVLDGNTLPEGSMAQVIADTGIFFSTDARTEKTPNTEFLSTNNGIDMSTAEPLDIARVNGLIGDDSAPFFAHNEWDWQQVQAFGPNGGNTPHLVGSPVAGPETHYQFEATDVAGTIEFNDVIGPWERIFSPGSTTGVGNGNAEGPFGADTLEQARPLIDTTEGWDVTPAAPDNGTRTGRIEGANAVRFAVGEARTGRPMFAEIALRVNTVPFDPTFLDPLLGTGGNIDCAEVVGSDLSGNIPQDGRGQNNSWALYMGSPACVFLRNKFDLGVDKDIAVNGDQLTYTLDGSNLALTTENNATACIKFDTAGLSHNPQLGELTPDSTTCSAAACGDTSALGGCLIYNLGNLAPGDDYTLSATFDINGGNGKDALTTQAVYASTELPIDTGTLKGGFTTQAVSVVTAVPLPNIIVDVDYGVDDATTAFTAAGTTATITGTLVNEGTRAFGPSEFMVHLPAGWTVADSGGTATEDVTIDGARLECDLNCGTEHPIFGFGGSALDVQPAGISGDSQVVTFQVNVPGGESTGLFDIDLAVSSSSTSFGPNFENLVDDAVTVNVGAVRSQAPVLDCPIGSTNQSITGTTGETSGTTVRTYFNLIERGDGLSDGAGDWSVSNFTDFGGMYGGLEIRASAQAPGELESELSAACEVTAQRECSDGIDNDGDGLTDFPADPGCDASTDNTEADPAAPECSDGIDNDTDGNTDLDDNGCASPDDNSEDDVPECSDGIDNDADGLIDFPDETGCTDAGDATELDLAECQNRIDDDGDGLVDFNGLDEDFNGTIDINADPGCLSDFDNDETDEAASNDIKARLLLVMDTSGSMNFNSCNATFTGGDGSTECPGADVEAAVCDSDTDGNGLPDDSRMAKVKTGLTNVVAGFGEVEFGLMRYSQRATDAFQCPSVLAGNQSGGWQGGGAAPCEGGFNEGELLVGFSGENQSELFAYMDGESNYPGVDPLVVPKGMDHELRGSGTTPIGGSLASARDLLFNVEAVDPVGDCRPYSVVLVTDGEETCGGDPAAEATALFNLGFDVYVIGFATSDPDVNAQLDSIANAGGTGSAIIVDDAASLSSAMAGIISDTLLAETCNGLDDDCDTLIDEDFTNLGDNCDNNELGLCFDEGTFVCAADGQGTECTANAGTPGTEECNGADDDCDGKFDEGFTLPCECVPTLEICNGVDDDCDNNVDEDTVDEPLPGVGGSCGFDIGECNAGTLECNNGSFDCVGVTDPGLEEDLSACNGLDDDCDTLVDEVSVSCYEFASGCDLGTGVCQGLCQIGTQSCDGGAPGACLGDIGPSAETCNGIDDDCDGAIDETFPIGDACDNGQQGQCFVSGQIICDPTDSEGDGDFVQCTAFPVPPGQEICNGLDDDCDGASDETPLPAPIGNACGGSGTSCDAGIIECVDGAPVCSGAQTGSAEVCNGVDDDCDLIIDEDPVNEPLGGIGDQCYTFGSGCDLGAGTCEGSCAFGATICQDGQAVCDGDVGPQAEETCNGADDDCDGNVDEAAQCPVDGDICHEGSCISPCGNGEFPCPLDFFCESIDGVGDFCSPDPCVDNECDPQTELCNQLTGECFDPCDNTNCPTGTVCQLGGCFDCFDPGFECDEGDKCEVSADTGFGACVTDPCFGVECEAGQFCSDGDCIDVDCDPECGDGFVCQNGTCVDDLCAGVECSANRVCDPSTGDCVRDLCENKFCPQGTACNPSDGECINDPCLNVECPEGLDCEVGFNGDATCVDNTVVDDGEYVAVGGGGGCAVSDTGESRGSFALLLLALVALRRRRRDGSE